jgi:hypothetical protein
MLSRSLRGALACLALCLLTLPLCAATTFNFSGYVQGRLTDTLGEIANAETPETFNMQRATVYMVANVDEHVKAVIFASGNTGAGGTATRLEHAYAQYINKPYQVRLGLSPIPFGIEAPISSCRLITLERSEVVTRLFLSLDAGAVYALDKGLYTYYLPGKGLNASLALVNGVGVGGGNVDGNSSKNTVARLGYYVPGGEIGLSLYDGDDLTAQKMDRYGFDLLTRQGDFTLQSEIIRGRDGAGAGSTVSSLGGYLIIAHRAKGSVSEPYVRAEVFDPNTIAGGDFFKSATIGYSHYLNPSSRVTAEYQAIEDGRNPEFEGRFGTQYQIIF